MKIIVIAFLRSCLLSSTGPWEEIKTDVKIQDLSISLDKDNNHVWAVSCNGDVLYRQNVSTQNPKVLVKLLHQ